MPAWQPLQAQILQHHHGMSLCYFGEQVGQLRSRLIGQIADMAHGGGEFDGEASLSLRQVYELSQFVRTGCMPGVRKHGGECGRPAVVDLLRVKRRVAQLMAWRQVRGGVGQSLVLQAAGAGAQQ
jgi:hypothetical protein